MNTTAKFLAAMSIIAVMAAIYFMGSTLPIQVPPKSPTTAIEAPGFPEIPSTVKDPPSEPSKRVYNSDTQCVDCHPDAVANYAKTGMARSFYLAAGAPRIETYGPKSKGIKDPGSKLEYSAFTDTEGRWWQDESVPGTDYRRRVEAKYVIGSGNHTRSYLGWVEGNLVELPLTWYVRRGIWDLSPGYHKNNYRFSRAVPPKCMFCHNNLTPIRDDTEAGYFEPLALGITCNRCHGDGTLHVERRVKGEPYDAKAEGEILNPSSLSPQSQNQLCGQCHLQGLARVLEPGQRWDSYDPRMPMNQYMTIFVPKGDDGPDFGIASHGARLKLSACAVKGEASCTHCHNPHKNDRALSRRVACMNCHQDGNHCPKPEAKTGDCAGCHMNLGETSDIPHVHFTDHFIRKTIGEESPVTTEPTAELESAFGHRQASEADIALALAHYEVWNQGSDTVGEAHRDTALSQLKKLIDSGIKEPRVLRAYGAIHYRKGTSRTALEPLSEAVEASPGSSQALVELGLAQQQARELAEAKQSLTMALKLRPDDRKAWVNLGSVLAEIGDYAQADKAYERADKLNPNVALTAINRGRNAAARKRNTDARRWYRRAIKRDPLSLLAYLNLALLEYDARRFNAARREIKAALKINDEYAAGYWLLGRIAMEQQEMKLAEAHMRRFLKLKPKEAAPYMELAMLLAKTNRERAAIAILYVAKEKVGNLPRFNAALRQLHNRPQRRMQMPDEGFTIE